MALLTSWNFGIGTEGPFLPDKFSTSKNWPKLNFNFTMSIKFRQGSLPDSGSDTMAEMSIPLKFATRPNINVQYQDYSVYGMRSRTQTRIEYGTITATLYDDVSNNSHSIITEFLKQASPISQINRRQASSIEGLQPSTVSYMENKHGIIDHIRITHHYVEQNTYKKTHYDYLNPKIQSIQMSDLDASTSSASEISFTFLYDGVNIT